MRHPDYPFTMVTVVLDPCKVQAEMPGVDFRSVGIFDTSRPKMRLWCFRYQCDRARFAALLEEKSELLRPDVPKPYTVS